jgi:unspecific monooxygenase
MPLLGDVFAMDTDKPSQSAAALAAELGPICEIRALGMRYVVTAGGDVVMDLNDETRFCKHLGPDMEALRVLGGDRHFTACSDGWPLQAVRHRRKILYWAAIRPT